MVATALETGILAGRGQQVVKLYSGARRSLDRSQQSANTTCVADTTEDLVAVRTRWHANARAGMRPRLQPFIGYGGFRTHARSGPTAQNTEDRDISPS